MMRRCRRALVAASALSWGVGCSQSDGETRFADELARRDEFTRSSLEARGASRALGVASTSEVQFGMGFGPLSFESDEKDGHTSFTNHAFRWMGQHAHVRLKTRGGKPMKLLVVGWMHEKVVMTSPVIRVFVDGIYIKSTPPIGKDGHYWIETIVPDWALERPWVNLTLQTTAVGFHWSDPPELKVLNVYRFGWTEAS